MAYMTQQSLAKLQGATPCPILAGENKKDVNPMYAEKKAGYANAEVRIEAAPQETDLSKARKYLTGRLEEVSMEKRAVARKKYFMDLELPKTRGELAKALADGTLKFKVSDEKKDRPVNDWEPFRSIEIVNDKRDEAGYEAEKAATKAAYYAALDTIKTQDEKAGLEALKAFQAFTA